MNGDHSLAVHALVYLDHRATHLPSQILAENTMYQCGARAKVMRPLASAGLIATKERVLKAGTLWPVARRQKSLCAR